MEEEKNLGRLPAMARSWSLGFKNGRLEKGICITLIQGYLHE